MKPEFSFSKDQKNLIWRYLLWCFKTTKEDLDRVDRYFTQNIVDNYLLGELCNNASCSKDNLDEYENLVKEFEDYAGQKLKNANLKKFNDDKQHDYKPEYLYLKNRFEFIEKAIIHFFNEDALHEIQNLYEKEMTQRILSAREHA